jgi:hypothetical protein
MMKMKNFWRMQGKLYMPGTIDNNYPAAQFQDNLVGRMKNQGKLGNSDSFGFPTLSMTGDSDTLTDFSNVTSGAVQNTAYPLNTITLPANCFTVSGRGLSIEFWGLTAANANAKNITLNFGANVIAQVVGSVVNAGPYYAFLTLIRIGANLFNAVGSIQVGTAVAPLLNVAAGITQAENAQIVINITGANTAAAAASAAGQGAIGCFFS